MFLAVVCFGCVFSCLVLFMVWFACGVLVVLLVIVAFCCMQLWVYVLLRLRVLIGLISGCFNCVLWCDLVVVWFYCYRIAALFLVTLCVCELFGVLFAISWVWCLVVYV